MSLPVRSSSKSSQPYSASGDSPPPAATASGTVKTPQKSTRSFAAASKEPGMAGSTETSSPLSTPPSIPEEAAPHAASALSFTTNSLSDAPGETATNLPGPEEFAKPEPTTISNETIPCSSPLPHQSDSKEDSLEATTKRLREDEEAEEPQPAKKVAKRSKAKAKSRVAAVPKQPSTSKAAAKKTVAKKRTPPVPPQNSRPTRNRKAPDRLENMAEPSHPKAIAVKKGASKVFDPVYITTNSTSRLGKADIYHMLLEPAAWTSLSAIQQQMLVSMLPESDTNKAILDKIESDETQGTRPQAFTMSNDCFRTDVAKFKEDLKNGHLAKTWQTAAEQAVMARAAGEYDEWKAAEAELWWGQKSKKSE